MSEVSTLNERRRAVIRALATTQQHDGLSAAALAEGARACSLSVDRTRDWVKAGEYAPRSRGRAPWRPSDDDVDLLFECGGQWAAFCRAKGKLKQDCPTAPRVAEAFRRILTAQELAYFEAGVPGWNDYKLYLQQPTTHRNEAWQMDDKEVSVRVQMPGHRHPLDSVWVTFAIDAHTRAVMGYAVNETQTAQDVLATLRKAVDPQIGHGSFHGVPEKVITDRGANYKAGSVTGALLALGVQHVIAPPRSPRFKGKIERFNDTFEQGFVKLCEGTRVGRLAYGEEQLERSFLTLQQLLVRMEEFVDEYNFERVHSALGMTPADAWAQDPHPLVVPEGNLTYLCSGHTRVKVWGDGIRFGGRNRRWSHPKMHNLVGETVDLYYTPHDRRFVDVMHQGEFLCTAQPVEALTDEQVEELAELQRAARADVDARRRRAVGKRRLRTASATAPGQGQEQITTITEAEAEAAGLEPSRVGRPEAGKAKPLLEIPDFDVVDDEEAVA